MLSIYPACFFIEDDGYTVVFPDLNYLATCGDTLNEAFTIAVDCLAGYLYMNTIKGVENAAASLPEAIDIAAVAKEINADPTGAFINMVTVDVSEYAKTHFEKAVKKTLTIPAWLNQAAEARSVNFSQLLQDSLRKYMDL